METRRLQLGLLPGAAQAARPQTSHEGEFWVSIEDFRQRFAMLYSCQVLCTTLQGGSWNFMLMANKWSGARAAGCPNFDGWQRNPQFVIRPLRATKVVLVLSQFSIGKPGWSNHPIGLMVLSCGGLRRGRAPLKRTEAVASSAFLRSGSVSLDIELAAELYTIVGCTFEPGQEASFMVCIYASGPVELRDYAEDGWTCEHDSSHGQLVVGRRKPGGSGRDRVVAPPPPMLARFSGSFLHVRNHLARKTSSMYSMPRSEKATSREAVSAECSSGRNTSHGSLFPLTARSRASSTLQSPVLETAPEDGSVHAPHSPISSKRV